MEAGERPGGLPAAPQPPFAICLPVYAEMALGEQLNKPGISPAYAGLIPGFVGFKLCDTESHQSLQLVVTSATIYVYLLIELSSSRVMSPS